MLTKLYTVFIFNKVLCTYFCVLKLIEVYTDIKFYIDMDVNKKEKFAVCRGRRSGGTSLYTKRRFKGNRYAKLANAK